MAAVINNRVKSTRRTNFFPPTWNSGRCEYRNFMGKAENPAQNSIFRGQVTGKSLQGRLQGDRLLRSRWRAAEPQLKQRPPQRHRATEKATGNRQQATVRAKAKPQTQRTQRSRATPKISRRFSQMSAD